MKVLQCEMCGNEGPVRKILIEGAPMMVCAQCSRFGKPIESPKKEKPSFSTYSKKAPKTPQNQLNSKPKPPSSPIKGKSEKILIEDYGQLIQSARQALGLNRRDFALKIKETETLLARIENQKLVPSDRVVKKLEKELEIELYVDPLDISVDSETTPTSQTTIGSIVSIKKRKRDN